MSPFRNGSLLSLALGHFVVDFYSGTLPLLLAVQTVPLGLTPGQIGLLALGYRMASSLTQPLFGLLADRLSARMLTLGAVVWQATFIGLSGLAGSFEVLLALTATAGLGSAAFHPPGAAGVPRVSTSEQRGGAMSVFLLGGTSGFAFGPLVSGYVFAALGPRGTLVLPLIGLAALPVLLAGLRRVPPAPRPGPAVVKAETPVHVALGSVALAIGLLAALIGFRSWTADSFSTYLPQVLITRGGGLAYAGNITFLFALGGAAGSLTAGFLSDRVGRHKVIFATLLVAAPMVVGVLTSQGAWLALFAFGLGFGSHASLPLTLLLGQELAPGRTALMSGLTLGFTFIMGGIGTAITGAIAERVGLVPALSWMWVLPLVSAAATAALALVQRRRRAMLARSIGATGE